jgi:hypothetical protein
MVRAMSSEPPTGPELSRANRAVDRSCAHCCSGERLGNCCSMRDDSMSAIVVRRDIVGEAALEVCDRATRRRPLRRRTSGG